LSAAVRTQLAAIPWRRLVYVSCNLDTLARDLIEMGGTIVSVVPVDLFPQTRHIETVVTLAR
ncbi:MAG: 23S rRNA (uracil(1939)-C(5))-methyltransferase RlmD, partial [Myxococcota bacterium]